VAVDDGSVVGDESIGDHYGPVRDSTVSQSNRVANLQDEPDVSRSCGSRRSARLSRTGCVDDRSGDQGQVETVRSTPETRPASQNSSPRQSSASITSHAGPAPSDAGSVPIATGGTGPALGVSLLEVQALHEGNGRGVVDQSGTLCQQSDRHERHPSLRQSTSFHDAGDVVSERWRRVLAHQDADGHTHDIRAFLCGNLDSLSRDTAVKLAKIAGQFAIDEHGVLRYVSLKPSARDRPAKLVVSVSMRKDLLHHCHAEMQGGHQGVTRTYERVQSEYYWLGMYNDVVQYCRECVDCSTGKGQPVNTGPSPGNIMPEYPFHVVSMDFVLPLPPSEHGNTALFLFQDMFSA
jgi:hypothetical protein